MWFPRPPDYGSPDVRRDLVAGLTVTVVLIPQAMAYGLLAGVDPVYGLYAALLPLLVYTLLASSPHVAVGPTALASLLTLSGLTHLATPNTPEFLLLAVALAALTGLLQLLFGLLRLGGMVSLLSRPVLSGFVSAAALLIVASQVKSFLGLDMPRTTYLHDTAIQLVAHLDSLHWPTALLGTLTLLALAAGKRWWPRLPVMLIWVVAATGLVYLLRLDQTGIAVVGEVPAGLPAFSTPALDWSVVGELLPVAAVLALISFIETLSIGQALGARHGYYHVRPNRELVALGLSKIAGSFFSAIPTSASFGRSAVLEESGGRSPLAGLVSLVLLAIVLLFLTPLFYYLPVAVLAAIIIFSVGKLLDLEEMQRLYRLAPRELAVLLVTFLFTLFAGLQYGIAGGVVLSLTFVFLRAARPHLAELGRIPGTNAFRNVNRFAAAEVDPELLIVRFDAELYFGNAEYFGDRILDMAEEKGEPLRAVILDGHTINDLDTTGLHALEQLYEGLQSRGIDLYLTGMIGPVRDFLYRSGLMERMGVGAYFLSIQDAIRHFKGQGDPRDWDRPAVQHD
ncbi:SulP family sulfate permease [Lewinella marina]|uniref:Sodium-independent anion transporter n=1 Tax=Neolewinella marina TaxID=438751 RepID=A0A2G0CBS5_9BACT|nr:sulfate permease [Neolewinella marina]NJB87049.1 SulP family sulfate permease [Neolewinella marina]PHK97415.1 sodium-independent anion transporter [Neolewinella marina]